MKLKIIDIISLIIAVFGLSPIYAESLAKAEFEYDAKNYIAAFEIWNEQAKLDEPAAISGLGQLYLFGQGVEKDEKYAFNLSKKAAELGDARGQSTLGLIFYWGYGIPKDYAQAAYWFQKAANLNRHQAQYYLAWMYQYGQGILQDFKQAAYWHERASNLGNIYSTTQLSILYAGGIGVQKDYSKSFKLALQAAEQGETLAQRHLGDLYTYGNGIELDYVKAIYWYRQAAGKRDLDAESTLGHFYWYGLGVTIDYQLAIDWYKKSGEQGNKYAITHLGTSLLAGTKVPKDEAAAAYWFRKGAEANDKFSMAMLGYMYERGLGLPISESIATEWYTKILSPIKKEAIPESKDIQSQLSFNNLAKTGIFEDIPRSPLSYRIDQNNNIDLTGTLQARQAWDELSIFLKSTEATAIILMAYQGPSLDNLLDSNLLARNRLEIKSAIAVLAELHNTTSAISQLSPRALEWLSIISIALRSKVDSDKTNIEKLELGTRLVKSYKPSDIFYLQGNRLLWEAWVLKYFKSKDSEFKKEASVILKNIISDWIQPAALLNEAIFEYQTDYINGYCRVLANVLALYQATPPSDDIDVVNSKTRVIRTILEDASYCSISHPDSYIAILDRFKSGLIQSKQSKNAFQIGEIIRNFKPPTDDIKLAISGHIERGGQLAALGRNQEAFVEMIQARYLSKVHYELGWMKDANRSLARILVRLGDANGAISLLTPQLHNDHLNSNAYSYCLNASAINSAMKASEVSSAGIPLLKTCIELFFRKENLKSRSSAYVDWLFFEEFFKELEGSLIDAGRLEEAQVVIDMFSEHEYLDFTRRSNSAETVHTRIGLTPTEARWMSRYREIADRLAALGKEEQALQEQAKRGLSDEQKRRQAVVAADLKVAQTAFETFINQMRQEFAAVGISKATDVAESSLQALTEVRRLVKSLGDDVALLQIRVREEQVSLLLTTPGVQLARSVKIKTQDLSRQVAEFGRLLRDPKSDPLPAAQALYKLLLAPVEQDLQQAGAKTVMLSLDGVLRYLPFGVLHDGQRFALQRWNLPIYTSVVRERLRDATNANWQAVGLGVTRAHGSFKALPAVRTEMNSIIRTGASGVLPGEVHLDEAFTAQRLKAVSQRQFSVVHVASHFQFSPGTEVNSFLLLGDGSQLTLGDIRTQNYRFDDVDLLTLSACDTGLGGGRDQRGREIEGFGVIAQQQGAKAVLATLWQVADSSTATLMGDMYLRRTQSGLSKIEALRQAQVALASQPRTAHPFYWAPFILMGNWK